MREKRVVRIFENLNYFCEVFSSIPISTLNEVGKTAATLICSILTYQVAAVLFIGDEDGEPQLLASKGVNEGSVAAWNSREAFIKHLLRDISISTIFKCETLNESIAGSARRLGLGDMFLAVPLKSREHNMEQIGFVIAAQPRRNFEPDVEMMGLEIIAGIVAGALKNCINRTMLLETNRRIQNESMRRKRTEEALQKREAELEAQTYHLQEVNTTLKVLLKQREKDRSDLEEKVLSNMKQLVSPYLQRLKMIGLNSNQRTLVSILESNLDNIVSSFTSKLSSQSAGLTPMEIRTADLVKEGKTNKEIGEILCLSPYTVKFHRYNLRNKLGLKNKKINLRSHLLSLVK